MSFAATTDAHAGTLVIGLGNPILGDDGVGWRVAEALEERLDADPATRAAVGPVEIDRLAVGGLQLMERLVGYEHVVLADATADGRPPGTAWTGPLHETMWRSAEHLDSSHDMTLARALEMGEALGAPLPHDITLVAVSVDHLGDFGEQLSPPVEAAIEPAVDWILGMLQAARRAH